jgi:hypothetical protein
MAQCRGPLALERDLAEQAGVVLAQITRLTTDGARMLAAQMGCSGRQGQTSGRSSCKRVWGFTWQPSGRRTCHGTVCILVGAAWPLRPNGCKGAVRYCLQVSRGGRLRRTTPMVRAGRRCVLDLRRNFLPCSYPASGGSWVCCAHRWVFAYLGRHPTPNRVVLLAPPDVNLVGRGPLCVGWPLGAVESLHLARSRAGGPATSRDDPVARLSTAPQDWSFPALEK